MENFNDLKLFEKNLIELRKLYKERATEIIEIKFLKKFPTIPWILIILFLNNLFFILYPILKMGRLLVIAHAIFAIFSIFYYFNLKNNHYDKKLKEYQLSGLSKYSHYFFKEEERNNIIFSIKNNINNLNSRIIELHKENKILLKNKDIWKEFLEDLNYYYDKYYSFLITKNKFNILFSQSKNNFDFIEKKSELNKIESIIDNIKQENQFKSEQELNNDMIKSF